MLGAGIGSILVLPLAYATPNYPALVLGNAVLGIAAAAIPVGLDLAAGSRLRRWLSAPLLVQVGVVSYGIYLWHGPLLRFAETAGLDGVAWRSGAAAVAVLAAAISYRYLERPLRRWVRTRVPAS
jgi:peptidoglycan/LPS O-acetylase OafA/YrhL